MPKTHPPYAPQAMSPVRLSSLGWIKRCSGWRAAVAVATVSLALGFLFSYPLLTALSVPSGFLDWDFHLAFSWVQYDTIWRFHQIPLWNPYKCGGIPALGNPQDRILTPFTLVHLLAGPIAGLYHRAALIVEPHHRAVVSPAAAPPNAR